MKFRFAKRLICGALVGALAFGGSFSSPVIEVQAAELGDEEYEAELQRILQGLREKGFSEEAIKDYEEGARRSRGNAKKAANQGNSPVVDSNVGNIAENALTNETAVNAEFDADFYARTYPDVVAVLGTDKNVLYNHYLTYGKAEGRRGCAVTAAEWTAEDEAYVQEALESFRKDGFSEEAIKEFEEDVRGSRINAKKAGLVDNASNTSTVTFDADYYALNNPDVVAALGTSRDALYNHYIKYGKAEGRKASAADAQ